MAPPEVIANPKAEVTPAKFTSPVAVIVTCPEKEADPKENDEEPSTVIVVAA